MKAKNDLDLLIFFSSLFGFCIFYNVTLQLKRKNHFAVSYNNFVKGMLIILQEILMLQKHEKAGYIRKLNYKSYTK